MIHIFAYDTLQHLYRTDIPIENLKQALEDPNLYLWVDFDNPTPEETGILESVFALDPMAIEDCIHPRQSPKLETFADYHFFIVHGWHPPHENHDYPFIELHGFLGDRYLITYHDSLIPGIDAAKKHIAHHNRCRLENGTAYLAYQILDQMIDTYLPVLDYFDERLASMEQHIIKRPMNDKSAQRYLNLSHQILNLRRSSVKNQQLFYQLSHSDMRFIDENEARLFRDIYDHVVRVVDMSEHYQQTLRSVLDIHFSLTANKANQVAQFLTIIATIMLPLSVITGIYGMNFRWMPFLESPNGFYIIMGLMALVVVGMLISFRKRKWI